jgi:hypothetical protein
MKARSGKLSSRSGANKMAVVSILRWIDKNFQSEGRLAHPDSGGWKPLAPSTIASRNRRQRVKAARTGARERGSIGAGRTPILQDTGALKGRWHYTVQQDGARVWSGVEYGPYHDQQDSKGRGKLPQRRILPTVPQIMPTLRRIYGTFVKTSLKE